ncbi:MAG: efflux RND transporter periplasmic adaptor subunit, partial [Gammaproteobacteria bacterium]|nr:efflux RND transporter periplasmic adaptor subunit [Gammaproteobacteria bacterium]
MQFYARVTLSAFCALAAATLVGCGDSAPSAAGPSGGAAPEVTVARPLVREIVDWDDHVGRFEAVQRVDLRPRVTGYLVGVHFDDGELVEAGDLLFTIDPRPFEAALAEAQGRAAAAAARVENARTELERAAGLVDIQAVSTEEYEALEADLRSAEADLEAARAAVAAHQLDV